jgi:hypothetical protein
MCAECPVHTEDVGRLSSSQRRSPTEGRRSAACTRVPPWVRKGKSGSWRAACIKFGAPPLVVPHRRGTVILMDTPRVIPSVLRAPLTTLLYHACYQRIDHGVVPRSVHALIPNVRIGARYGQRLGVPCTLATATVRRTGSLHWTLARAYIGESHLGHVPQVSTLASIKAAIHSRCLTPIAVASPRAATTPVAHLSTKGDAQAFTGCLVDVAAQSGGHANTTRRHAPAHGARGGTLSHSSGAAGEWGAVVDTGSEGRHR